MAGKHEVHACVRERLRALHPIVKHESTEYFGLYGHVRDDVVVTHTDDGLTVLLRLLALLEDPLHKLGGYPACGILNIVTTIGDVRGIPVGIHNDEPVAALEANCIGELARFALCGGEDILIGVCDEVAAEILVDLAEFVGSRDFCRLLYTVFKGYSVIVVDVVVAVDSNDVNTGLLLEGLELCRESHMTLIFAVVRKIAGQKHIVALLLDRPVEGCVNEGVSLVMLTRASFIPLVVGFAVACFGVAGTPCGFGKVMDV